MSSRNFVKRAVVLGVTTLIGPVVGIVMRRLRRGAYCVAVNNGMATLWPVWDASPQLFLPGELT